MLKRVMTVVAGTAVFVTAIGVSASADTVDKVVNVVQNAVDPSAIDVNGVTEAVDGTVDAVDGTVDRAIGGTKPVVGGDVVGDVGGGDVGGGGVIDHAGPVRGTSPVVGYISIESSDTVGLAPTWQVWGQLADPTQWACAGAGTASSYSVKCVPTVAVLPIAYKCDVLHADINTASANSSGRTSLDCDSDGTGEATTNIVSGAGGWDSKWSIDGRGVSAFTCTIDHAKGDWRGGCGDPGVPTATIG